MTEYFVKHTGKWLFPHLGRDQRKRRMYIILLVITVSLICTTWLSVWMMSADASTSHGVMLLGAFP